MRRRGVLAGAAAALLARPAVAQVPIRVQDLLGREVVLPGPARRVVLGSGRHLAVLNLLLPDPAAVVVGWADDLKRGQPGEYDAFRRRFPALESVPVLGRGAEPMGAEPVLALRPDLVLLSRVTAAAAGGILLRALEAARVPVAVIDFFQQPLTDTRPSLALLGQALGRVEQADAFLGFYEERIARLRALLPQEGTRPSVFMHAHAGGTECCFSPGRGTFDDFITLAGGSNIGRDRLPGVNGQLGLEYVLTRNAEFYVATGGTFNGRGGVELGAGIAPEAAARSLDAELAAQRLAGLAAARGGRAYAVWHGFNDSPAHVLAIEAMARWFHPEAAVGIDPAASLAELNRRFAAVPMEGTFWCKAG